VARVIGAPSIVVVPGSRPGGFNRHESVSDAVEVLRIMSDVAGDVGLAFEFLGKPGCAVPVLDMAIEIVARVDRQNVGMVIDTFHFHAGGSRLDDLADVPIDKLFVVHINGCDDVPRDQLTDAHRLYPGYGPIPIGAILTRLRALGFDGTASVEIFRPEYWEQDPRHVASAARETAERVLAEAGYAVDP
jgi:2-keto-myo-inositol isomerase